MTNTLDIHEAFLSQYPGVDPYGIYCQFTGKMIGNSFESSEFMQEQIALGADPESIADDLAVRIFAAMRPSIRWNKLTGSTIDELRRSHKIETLAYMLNRLFTPADWKGNIFALHHDRIRLFANLCERATAGTEVESNFIDNVLYMMIELDAMHGLVKLVAPFKCEDFLNPQISPEELFAIIDAFHTRQTKAYYAMVKQQEMQTKWIQNGSAPSRVARINQFIESKPPTKASTVKAEKAAKQSFMDGLLAEILNESTPEQAAEVKPDPVPTPVAAPAVRKLTRMPSFLAKKG